MPGMAKRKPNTVSPVVTKKPHRAGVAQGFYLDPEVSEALDRYIADSQNTEAKATKTSVFTFAVRGFLEERGYLKAKK